MFLIRVTDQDIIDADDIRGIKSFIGGGIEVFTKSNEIFYVEKGREDKFINHLSAVNDNKCLNLVEFIKEWKDFGKK